MKLNNDFAIIGISCKFPGALNISEFWDNLRNGVESIKHFTKEELKNSGYESKTIEDKNFVRSKGIIDTVDFFDSDFFNINNRDANLLDPQTRLALQCVWEALENGGYSPNIYSGKIGLFLSAAPNFKWEKKNILADTDENITNQFSLMQLIDKDFLSQYISYRLNLKGPSYSNYTACSSSLINLSIACKELSHGSCDIAVAGGISVLLPQKWGYLYEEGSIVSNDGHVKSFDENASGTVFSDGAGFVVVKKLEDAINDKDNIYAVIKGIGINNDGNEKAAFSAPSVKGQAKAILASLQDANVDAIDIDYIEAHGSGTLLGDKIELKAMANVFKANGKKQFNIGTVKPNIGHLNVASGIAGLLKSILILKNREIPPNINFHQPNAILKEFSQFKVITETTPLKQKKNIHIGVSSFGIGGTNAHCILEEAPKTNIVTENRTELLVYSAKTKDALIDVQNNLNSFLAENKDENLTNIAYSLAVRKGHFDYRDFSVMSIDGAQTTDSKYVKNNQTDSIKDFPVVFMFPGQGSQYFKMAKGLYNYFSQFKETIDECYGILKNINSVDFNTLLLNFSDSEIEDAKEINQTQIAQPLIFIVEYALAKLLISLGFKPFAMIGHSIGEYVAACLSGVFSLNDALEIVSKRAELMNKMPKGSMLSVKLPASDVQKYIENNSLCIASINSKNYTVISGSDKEIKEVEEELKKCNIPNVLLKTSHAFHSSMMNNVTKEFSDFLKKYKFNEPDIPYISNVSGTWISNEEATNPNYYANHIIEAVEFHQGLTELLEQTKSVFLEVGPGYALSTFLNMHESKKLTNHFYNVMPHANESLDQVSYFLNAIGKIYKDGYSINWENFYCNVAKSTIPLPTYPFLKKKFNLTTAQSNEPKRNDIKDWFYIPTWERTFDTIGIFGNKSQKYKLVFHKDDELSKKVVGYLENKGEGIITIELGQGYSRLDKLKFQIDPINKEGLAVIFEILQTENYEFEDIIYLWSILPPKAEGTTVHSFQEAQQVGYYNVMALVQTINNKIKSQVNLKVITNNINEVIGNDSLCPEHSTLNGLIRGIPTEYRNIACSIVDVDYREKDINIELLLNIASKRLFTGLRNNNAWLPKFVPVKLSEKYESNDFLVDKGVYLVLGGTAGIGFEFASILVEKANARLVIVGRSKIPSRDLWDSILENKENAGYQRIRNLKKLEDKGAEVLYLDVDISNENELKVAIDTSVDRFGKINGIIHAAGHLNIDHFTPIQMLNQEIMDDYFKFKIHTSVLLNKLLKDIKLDFCLLVSSIASYALGIGMTGYSSLNNFLDSYVKSLGAQSSWIVLNLDAWKLHVSKEEFGALKDILGKFAINSKDGLRAIFRIMNWRSSNQVVQTAFDINYRINQVTNDFIPENNKSNEDTIIKPSMPEHANDIESYLINLVKEYLHVDKINVEASFYELGISSLDMVNLNVNLRNTLSIDIPLVKMFQYSNVKKLSEYIMTKDKDPDGELEKEEVKQNQIANRNKISQRKALKKGSN